MHKILLSLAVLPLVASCTSMQPQSHKPPSYYGRTEAEIAAMEAENAARAPTSTTTGSQQSSGQMRTEYTRPYKRGDFSLLFGVRNMRDKDSWGPVSDQMAAGINWNYEPTGSIIGFDTSFFYATDTADVQTTPGDWARIRGESYEFAMGGIKSFFLGSSPLRAYVGAGAALLSTRLERVDSNTLQSGSDNTFGIYGRVGLVFQIRWDGHIGIDYRALGGTDSDILGHSFNSDYDQFTFNFGTSF